MSMLGRIIGTDEPKIPVHQFYGDLVEYSVSPQQTSRAELIERYEVAPDEENELDWLLGRIDQQSNFTNKFGLCDICHRIFMLSEAQMAYQTVQECKDRINAYTGWGS